MMHEEANLVKKNRNIQKSMLTFVQKFVMESPGFEVNGNQVLSNTQQKETLHGFSLLLRDTKELCVDNI